MAEVFRNVGRVFRISATVVGEGVATCILGDASDGKNGTITVCIVPGAGYAGGSISVKARPRNPEATQPVAPPMPVVPVPFSAIPFLTFSVAGAATSPPAWSAAALVGAAIIQVPATGLQIALDVTAITGGEAWIYWTPTTGHAAIP